MMRRTWIKLFCDRTLHGTCFTELEPDERFIWFGFLLLAGDGTVDGKVCITQNVGYTDDQIAELLKVETELLKRAKKKCVKFEKIKVLESNIIEILNWKRYQSEYRRQKVYRDAKKEEKSLKLSKEEKEKKEERRERREERGKSNSELQLKVTKEEELPPLPTNLDFKIQDDLKMQRANIRRLQRLYEKRKKTPSPEYDKKAARQKIDTLIKEYEEAIADFSD